MSKAYRKRHDREVKSSMHTIVQVDKYLDKGGSLKPELLCLPAIVPQMHLMRYYVSNLTKLQVQEIECPTIHEV